MRFFYIYLLCLILFSGCQTGQKYEKPTIAVPKEWKGPFISKKITDVDQWWEIFQDEELNSIEKKLMNRNWDIYVAIQKVLEARANAGISKSKLYPQLNANGNYAFFQDFFKIKKLGTTPSPFGTNKVTVYAQEFLFPNLFSYELDLWGKYRAQYHSSLYKTESLEEAMHATVLTLTAECASYYFNLRSLTTSLEIIKKQQEALKQQCKLQKLRYTKGLINEILYDSTEQQLHTLNVKFYELLNQKTKFENALATLLGEPASSYSFKQTVFLNALPPKVPAGIPSTLLLRRPDVKQAERESASLFSLINASKASYFPAFNLTSGVGVFGITLKDLFSIKSFLWQAGASLAQFVYDAGKRKNEVEAAKAKFRQAEGAYKQKILTALEEVETALSALYEQNRAHYALEKNVILAEKEAHLTQKRVTHGLSNNLDLLEKHYALLEREQEALSSRTSLYQSTIQFIKALGGGWE